VPTVTVNLFAARRAMPQALFRRLGIGEIGIIGTAAAIANAVFNATGKRVRDLPITLDMLLFRAWQRACPQTG
jgi:CO/xanthine dehydrogenase Mo-binding subunit